MMLLEDGRMCLIGGAERSANMPVEGAGLTALIILCVVAGTYPRLMISVYDS